MHELPTSLVENAGLPAYDAGEYRDRRQAEVDEAARTGKVPPALLRRWEDRLEDVALWRFRPDRRSTATSRSERVLVHGEKVTGILHWGDACVADPADDLAWLLVAAHPDTTDSIMEAYQLRRTELTDPHLADRALLAGELALARWLLYGVRTQDAEIIDDAVAMLEDLDAHTREDQGAEAESPAGVTDRSVAWGGLHNARDLGGLPAGTTVTRPGRIFRTPRLDGLDEQGWSELVDAGVRTIVDLRNPHEIEPLPLPAGVTRLHRPVEVWADARVHGALGRGARLAGVLPGEPRARGRSWSSPPSAPSRTPPTARSSSTAPRAGTGPAWSRRSCCRWPGCPRTRSSRTTRSPSPR